jgi:tetratricopeptide (TPR) repeat protein
MNKLARHRHIVVSNYTEARSLFERAVGIVEKTLGPDDPRTGACLNNLADLLREQGDLAAARPLQERALTICEKNFGADHPNTAVSLCNLANLLRDQGDLAGEQPLYERELAI